MANRIFAYMFSALLILLGAVIWTGHLVGQSTSAGIPNELPGKIWGDWGFVLSGLSVILILFYKIRRFWPRMIATVLNVINLAFSLAALALPTTLGHILPTMLVGFYVAIGELLLLSAIINFGALWQPNLNRELRGSRVPQMQ